MMTNKRVQVSTCMREGSTVESRIRNHELFVDQPRGSGGRDAGPTAFEYLLLSLAGCLSSIGRQVATKRQINLRGIDIKVEGNLAPLQVNGSNNGTSLSEINVFARIDADLSLEEKKQFLMDVDRLCPVSDTLLNTNTIFSVVED